MATLVQVRDVPDAVHRTLKARAAASGTSLSAYLRAVLAREASRPTAAELSARIAARGPVELSDPTAAAVRRLRKRGE